MMGLHPGEHTLRNTISVTTEDSFDLNNFVLYSGKTPQSSSLLLQQTGMTPHCVSDLRKPPLLELVSETL